jgi:hypothetical protein
MNAETQTAVEVSRLFAPHILLPTQMARSAANRWLRHLYGAILEDALACLEGKGPASQPGRAGDVARRRREAWAWMMSDVETCFSFPTICAVLDLNIEAVRAEARRRVAPGGEMPTDTVPGLQ